MKIQYTLKISFIAVFLMISKLVIAQQEEMYTQFMNNKLVYNPAFAGYYTHTSLTALYRKQWIGFDGAPETFMASANIPLNGGRAGLGSVIQQTNIGVSKKSTLGAKYAYRIPVGQDGVLSMGIETSLRQFQLDFNDPSLIAIDGIANDDVLNRKNIDKTIFNFGAGLYFHRPDFYLGISSPRLLESKLDEGENHIMSKEVRHLYFMAGMGLDLSYLTVLKPQILVKYAKNAPIDIDFNVSAVYDNQFTAGLTWRHGGNKGAAGESLDFIFQVQTTDQLKFGVGYDFALSKLRTYQNGSIEAMVEYNFGSIKKKKNRRSVNPRFF